MYGEDVSSREGERIKLKELCLIRACLLIILVLQAAQICPWKRQMTKDWKKGAGQFSDCSSMYSNCDSAKQTQRLRGPSSVFVPQFLLYIFWLIVRFLVVCACALVYCMILYSQGLLCLCFDFESGNKGMKRLRTSHSERGWWAQLCLETEEIHSSTEATPGLKVPR